MTPEEILAKHKAIALSHMSAGLRRSANSDSIWPEIYFNQDTKRYFRPHHEKERRFIYEDSPRRMLLKGGEGSGKSTSGVIKTLHRLRRGMNGIFVGSDFPHFKKSAWPEFRNWCPIGAVVKNQQRMISPTWDAGGGFTLHIHNELGGISTLYCGGIEDPFSWRGPNVNFFHFDEAERHNNPSALKVLDGRIRIPGPHGEPPQGWLTTTPRKHWLYDYFGGIEEGELPRMKEDDPLAKFKADAGVLTLKTSDNAANLEAGYVEKRRDSLPEAEARVLMDAAWEDLAESSPFLRDMKYWDEACLDTELPTATIHDPMIVSLDAAVNHDTFGMVGITKHPKKNRCLAVQLAHAWIPKKNGEELDFVQIEEEIRQILAPFNILKIVYDRTELHLMGQRLKEGTEKYPRGYVTEVFSQMGAREVADKQLLDLILERRLWHRDDNENAQFTRSHLFNSDRKTTDDRKLRIVKRHAAQKIDVAICLSMASFAALDFIPLTEGYVAMDSVSGGKGDVVQQLLGVIA